MEEVIFTHNKINTTIQCNFNEQMKDIFKKYSIKSGINIKSVYFEYSGNKINENLTLSQTIGQNEKLLNKIEILVYNIEELNNNENKTVIVKSNNIICPKCKEIASMKIKYDKIDIYGCKKGHNIKDILLNEFENTQNINISKIKCDKCKINNKGNIYNKLFYKCLNCKMNLCTKCKLSHDNDHNIIDYDKKDYICNEHNKSFIKYCNECKRKILLHYVKQIIKITKQQI